MRDHYEDPLLLYHWSPTSRRKQINKRGLVPGCRSIDGLWKPPHICYASSPSLAWDLSVNVPRNHDIPEWDLWVAWSDVPSHLEIVPFDFGGGPEDRVKEFRIYERIYKRDIWYVGSRPGINAEKRKKEAR